MRQQFEIYDRIVAFLRQPWGVAGLSDQPLGADSAQYVNNIIHLRTFRLSNVRSTPQCSWIVLQRAVLNLNY